MIRLPRESLHIAMFSVHSSPLGRIGNRDTGGMSVYIRQLALEMEKRGHRVDIFTRRQEADVPDMVRLDSRVRLIHLTAGPVRPLSPLDVFPLLPDFLKALERFKNDQDLFYHLIHSHYWLSGRLGAWAAPRWNVPHLFTFHTVGALKNLYCQKDRTEPLRLRMEHQLVKEVDRIIAATQMEKEHLTRHHGISPCRIGVVPCGVDLERFRPLEKRMCRAHLGLRAGEFVIVYVGRLARLKRIDRIIRALAHLRSDDGIRLMIVGGDGRLTADEIALRRLTQRLRVQDRVTFVGRVEQEKLPVFYNAADVLVLPSEYESFGLVGLEALACGLPVVATRVGGLTTILQEEVNGHLLNDGNPLSIARAIAKLRGTKGLPVFSPQSLRDSIREYSWSNIAAAVLQEYEMAMDAIPGLWGTQSAVEMSAL
ncbi:MAG: glycosyltransferase family 1 protein [Deltaproteobacteria bacterium]|nr:glycosyltransferase family 1 protein [Deltaproteobacteria bacterium]